MNIGIDIDGVLVDQRKFMIEKGTRFFNRIPKNKKTLDICEMFGVSEEEGKKFWARYLVEYATKGELKDGAKKVVEKYKKNGDKIFIITSREFSTKNNIAGSLMRYAVEKHLKKNGIEYDEIIFCDEDKTDAILRYNINVMIEDNVKNIKELSKKTNVIALFDKFDKNVMEIYDLNNVVYSFDWDGIDYRLEIFANELNKNYDGERLKDNRALKYYPMYQTMGEIKEEKIYDFMFAKNKFHMDAVALIYYGTKYTFKEFSKKIDECCNAFVAKGVKKGDIVSICMPNTPEAVIAFYALNKIGAIPNMIHPLKSQNEIKDYVNEGNSKLLIMFDGAYEKVKNVLRDTSLENVVVCSAADSMPLALKVPYSLSLKKENKFYQESHSNEFITWNEFIKSGKGYTHEKAEYKSSECAIILHTGGTTGKSKSVMLSEHNFNSYVAQFNRNIDNFSRGDSCAAIMPVFHGFGLCSSIHLPLSFCVSVNLVPKFDAKNFDSFLKRYKPNHIIGVPTVMRAMRNNKKIDAMDLSFIKTFTAGGDGIQKEEEIMNHEFLKSHNAKAEYSKGYGLTQSVAGVTYAFKDNNKLSSCGIPSVFTDLKIVEPGTENVLDCNVVGEICVSGPTNMIGYFNDSELTSKELRVHQDGKTWLHTGDLGRLDEDGVLFFAIRLDRMFISSGVNVYPQEVESIVSTLEFVDKCCFVPMYHAYKGKVGKLYITLKSNYENYCNEDIISEINYLCKLNLDKYHVPYEIEICKELPLTDVGKVNYKELEKANNYDAYTKKLVKEGVNNE